MAIFSRFLVALAVVALPQMAMAKQRETQVRLEITSRVPAFRGQTFGTRGEYEQITGVAHMRIDPLAPANRGIVDLRLAPRAADGMVEFSVDTVILRPRDASKARRVMFYDVVNRGMRLLSMMSGGRMTGPDDPGDGLLMREGLSLVWSGWQGDVAARGLIGARFPVARLKDGPVTGPISVEAIFDNTAGSTIKLPYAAASLDKGTARLTVRQLTNSPVQAIPATDWRFENDRSVSLTRPANMDAGAIYRIEYMAKDPWVMGLGFAATRDFLSWLRHAPAAAGNPLADIAAAPCERDAAGACANPGGGVFSSAVGFGGSQSGRYLRDFLWQGFNRDLKGRRVFDGLIPFIPGARRTFTNFRFAEPGRFSRQHEDHDVPGFTFPFAYGTLTDPVTGRRDGILKSCTMTRTCPKVFHIDTGAEFWQAGGSLVGTGGTQRDVPFPANVRAFMIASAPHATGMSGPNCRYGGNPLSPAPMVRALLLRMIDWSLDKREPPASRWPSVAAGDLVPASQLRGPSVPSQGLVWSRVYNRPIAPAGKGEWPVLLPVVDADGNDAPGLRLPELAAPLGTFLPWNPRRAGYGEGDLCLLAGSYLPFAKDAASRGGDTRASLAERYPAPGAREERYRAAVDGLRRDGFLLDEDAARLSAAGPGMQ